MTKMPPIIPMSTGSSSPPNLFVFFCVGFLGMMTCPIQAMDEKDRIQEYTSRGHVWPPNEFVPNTPGWRRIMERRLNQLTQIPHIQDRYNGYMVVVHSALTCKNFTENGWGVTKAPQVCCLGIHHNIKKARRRVQGI